MSLSTNLIRLRDQNGWSQEQLAEKLGVARSTVAKWESGKGVPIVAVVVRAELDGAERGGRTGIGMAVECRADERIGIINRNALFGSAGDCENSQRDNCEKAEVHIIKWIIIISTNIHKISPRLLRK